VEDGDKYIQKAKNVEKRINKYSREAERLVNRLSDKTIEFIDELSSTKKYDKIENIIIRTTSNICKKNSPRLNSIILSKAKIG